MFHDLKSFLHINTNSYPLYGMLIAALSFISLVFISKRFLNWQREACSFYTVHHTVCPNFEIVNYIVECSGLKVVCIRPVALAIVFLIASYLFCHVHISSIHIHDYNSVTVKFQLFFLPIL